ncbi:MAG: hypothetical protein KIH69_012790 [Anaerolineae bacterium]|nr:hypothetical protein [Anaerolineae bacterium]
MSHFKHPTRTLLIYSVLATGLSLGPAIVRSAEPPPNLPRSGQASSKVYVPITAQSLVPIEDAPTGQGNNGHIPLGTPDDEESPLTFYGAKKIFDAVEDVADGLGPVYNAQACRECHQSPMSGGSSQVSVIRAGRMTNSQFAEHAGGSLIHDRAIHYSLQEQIQDGNDIVAFRMSLSILGDGFVEAVPDETLIALAAAQPSDMRGEVVMVDVLEASGVKRVGRFGWKGQHASLLSFSVDAYLNEMGITSPLAPDENTSNGKSVAAYDTVADPEEAPSAEFPFGPDVHAFTNFMRALTAPARHDTAAKTQDAIDGQAIFNRIGCNTCHTPELVTAPAGTVLNGGTFTVTEALGSKRIRPFSDYLLHDIGTGDGIYQTGTPQARNKMRTAPLWGLHTRARFMHDGLSLTLPDAIQRHQGQALATRKAFHQLSDADKAKVLAFLRSL